eukprot:350561-Chlamydomonas_euryale.AAC.8
MRQSLHSPRPSPSAVAASAMERSAADPAPTPPEAATGKGLEEGALRLFCHPPRRVSSCRLSWPQRPCTQARHVDRCTAR